MSFCARCGHPESSHSDGLPEDAERLCSLCRECPGFLLDDEVISDSLTDEPYAYWKLGPA